MRKIITILACLGGTAAADVPPVTGHVCVRGARTYTCPNGAVLDVCDPCPGVAGGASVSGTTTGPVAPTQSWMIGAIVGPGYTKNDGTTDPNSSFLGGLDVSFLIGGRPGFAICGNAGVHYTIARDKTTMADGGGFLFPFTIGLEVKPRLSYRARLDLGATFGIELADSCALCGTSAISELHAGFEIYKHAHGAGFYIVKEVSLGSSGQLDFPAILVRIALLGRNTRLVW
jgi:hypothetical protein